MGKKRFGFAKSRVDGAIFIQADVSNVEDVKRYVAQTIDTFGKIDLFFNNAGISGSGVRTIECSIDEFNAIVDVNFKGVFYGLKFVINEMLKTGGGVIVNTASLGGSLNTYLGSIFRNKTCCCWADKSHCRRVWKGEYQDKCNRSGNQRNTDG